MDHASAGGEAGTQSLFAHRIGIDTRQEPVIFLREDCPVSRSEGFEAMSRVRIQSANQTIVATLMSVGPAILEANQAGLSEAAWRHLGVHEHESLTLSHPAPLESLSHVRAKVYGQRLGLDQLRSIMRDVADGRYMDVQLAAFITACAQHALSLEEITDLTEAMIGVGQRLNWPAARVVDKHCVGGLPGNRTTPIVVAIAASCGLVIPKTSSRAITSPSGTADTMETLAPVDLDLAAMRDVVQREGGCIVWGGSVSLSPADDLLIRVERALDLDSEGQLVASVLSKKLAAGSTDVVIDMPVGPSAKVRSAAAGRALTRQLVEVGRRLGIRVAVVPTEGLQPVGRGIGPALEARDILAVLRRQADAPPDLRRRALTLSGRLLEIGGAAGVGSGFGRAAEVLDSGRALAKFEAICEAQGGMREPPRAPYRYDVLAAAGGRVTGMDNRLLARIAKLAGAPLDKAAGVEMSVRLGDTIREGQPLFTIHAQSMGELEYARRFEAEHPLSILLE